MPRRELVLDVFVASPADVTPEREVVREVIAEWNSTWSRERGIRLNPISWELDSYPDFAEDTQDVLNRQLGDEYDIFIGILWARFGTPTKRAASGTAEEFERAYERHVKAPDDVKIMIYFKEEALRPSEIDPEQLKKVGDFRKKVSSLGGLYHKFSSTDEFAKLLRMHLGKQTQHWMTSSKQASVLRTLRSDTENALAELPGEDTGVRLDEENEDEGFLDLIERGSEGFRAVTRVTSQLTEVVNNYGEITNQCATELNAIPGDPSENLADRKRVIKKAATALVDMAEQTEALLPEFKDANATAMDAYGKAASLLLDFSTTDPTQIEEAIELIQTLRSTLYRSREQMATFRVTVESQPRVTTSFNKAKAKARRSLIALDEEMGTVINLNEEVERLMEGVRENILSAQDSEPEIEAATPDNK
ncbi:MAG: DUF4062 domain-containing protein [Proteobacteria bacterium]|nr:DUF4062 domain-containing protein [Pseudomonadota bacterium]